MSEHTEAPVAQATASPAASYQPASKRQIKAAAYAAEELAKQQWKHMLADAKALWTLISPEELTKAHGNIHVLAGLIQLRYHTNRQDADRQVHLFFSQHAPAPAIAKT